MPAMNGSFDNPTAGSSNTHIPSYLYGTINMSAFIASVGALHRWIVKAIDPSEASWLNIQKFDLCSLQPFNVSTLHRLYFLTGFSAPRSGISATTAPVA